MFSPLPPTPLAPCFVGSAVAKASVEIAVRPSGERWASDVTETALATLATRVQALNPLLIVLARDRRR